MQYGLAAGLSFCDCGGRVVILDAPADRYRQLGARASAALRRLARGEGAEPGAVDELMRLGVLSDGPDRRPLAAAAPPTARRSAVEEAPAQKPAALGEVAWELARAFWDVKRRPFAQLLEQICAERRRAVHGRIGGAAVLGAAASFERRRRLVPVEPVCLPDSLALLRFLRRRGLDADFVIGVRLGPFGAHCWLQAGDVVLNDALGTVMTFSPIRVC